MQDFKDIHIEWRSEISAIAGKYSELARNLLKPLIKGGARIKIIPDEAYLAPHLKIEDDELRKMVVDSQAIPESNIRVNQCIPGRFAPEKGKINVGYITWETTKFPKDWSPLINNTCHHLITTSESIKEVAEESGVKIPVSVVPPCIDSESWSPEGQKMEINGIDPDDVKFLYTANFIPRKNLEDLVLAFCVAFHNVNDAVLVVKTYGSQNTPSQQKSIRQGIASMKSKVKGFAHTPKVIVLDQILSEEQLKKITRSSDIYVTSSKGEGANLPLLQSMSMEKLVVANNFLSHKDYLDGSNSVLYDYSLRPCWDTVNPLYTSDQMWCSPDIESFIQKLQLAYSSIKSGTHKHVMENARKTVESQFSPEKNAETFAELIRKINNNVAERRGSTKDFIHQLAY